MKLQKDQLTEHFRLQEFACDGEMLVTPEYLIFVQKVLEPFRTWYNRPININSGFRTKEKNRAVGGVANSLHLRAMAVDFNFPTDYMKASKTRQNEFMQNLITKWNELCRSAGGFGQICWYGTYVHAGLSWQHEYFEDKRGK